MGQVADDIADSRLYDVHKPRVGPYQTSHFKQRLLFVHKTGDYVCWFAMNRLMLVHCVDVPVIPNLTREVTIGKYINDFVLDNTVFAARHLIQSGVCVPAPGTRTLLCDFHRLLHVEFSMDIVRLRSRGYIASIISGIGRDVCIQGPHVVGMKCTLRIGSVKLSLLPASFSKAVFFILLAVKFCPDSPWFGLPTDIVQRILTIPEFSL